ncbi:hypothetical protein Aspvir_006273 [Aspergillus viridinutans]|uniref:Uncharacterized protein n=1 Tax=Aspergillus viridinutans TaxID=75553 RepID=A0A9P3BTY6_ASPVI|nr:uncharacterized protein Aspvir_006273 [Aspergillus viridinutans]GIK02224.1 hypothetical protein Aspvir_006273 [Aspergillus viridinutans]
MSDEVEFNNTGDGPLMVPGFNGVPFDVIALSERMFVGSDCWYPSPFTARELEMLRLINSLTDRPGWDELVFDASTMQTWRSEAMAQFPLISPKAWECGVCKSDTIIPPAVSAEIQVFVASALNESAGQKDWEPSSNPQARRGSTASPDAKREWERGKYLYSLRYQWLPCEVEFCGPAGSTDMRITSYINNLHPHEQRPFYRTLENVMAKAIKPWNEVLVRLSLEWPDGVLPNKAGQEPMRIRTFGVEWDNRYPQWAEDLPTMLDVNRSTEDYQRALTRVKEYLSLPDHIFQFQHSEPGTTYSYEDWKAGRTAQAIISREDRNNVDQSMKLWWNRRGIMDPMLYNEMLRARDEVDHQFQTVKLQHKFREKGLQIIVKLWGIKLTPNNPSFLGEDWHADGLLNEYIAGVAIYCFDLENVTNIHISTMNRVSKNLGQCLYVKVARSGHCRFLTLWLVDPYYRICSTRNVPPQRLDWWEQEARSHLSSAHPLPQELADQIIAETGPWLMSLPEAQQHQRERAKDEAVAHEAQRKEIEHDTIRTQDNRGTSLPKPQRPGRLSPTPLPRRNSAPSAAQTESERERGLSAPLLAIRSRTSSSAPDTYTESTRAGCSAQAAAQLHTLVDRYTNLKLKTMSAEILHLPVSPQRSDGRLRCPAGADRLYSAAVALTETVMCFEVVAAVDAI